MSFFENTRDPKGFGGRLMVTMMNLAHTPVALWGLHFLHLAPDAKVLDCGCGGGANIKRLLKRCPRGIVKGVDYSFLICNEVNGDTDKDKKWTEIIDGMTIYKDTELKAYLEQAGFCDIAVHKSKTGWLCLTAVKQSDCGCGRQENEGL